MKASLRISMCGGLTITDDPCSTAATETWIPERKTKGRAPEAVLGKLKM